MRFNFSLFIMLACLSASAQVDDPVIEINHEAEAAYRDSVARHEGFWAIWHYMPHRCKNRRERYGWVDKSVFDFKGRVILPEEKLYNIWLFNDSTLAVQDFNKKDVRTYDTLMGLGIVTMQGLLDPWVGYMRKGMEEKFTLIDGAGRVFEIKPD